MGDNEVNYSDYYNLVPTYMDANLYPQEYLLLNEPYTSYVPVYNEGSTFQIIAGSFTVKKFFSSFEELRGLSDLKIDFKTPLKFIYTYEPDTRLHIFHNSDLSITCSNSDYQACLDEVIEEVSVLWKEIAMAEDYELTSDALRLKRYLLSIKK